MLTLKLNINKVIRKSVYGLLVGLSPILFSATAYAYGGKVSSPGTTPINEGSSEIVTFNLDAPIICQMQASPCEVDLNLVSSDPNYVSISPNPIIWSSAQWAQNMSATINTIDNGIYDNGETVTITATVTSNAAYYSNYNFNFPLTINNIDPPIAPSLINQSLDLTANSSIHTDVIDGISGDPDPSTLSIVSAPSHGTATISSNDIVFAPDKDYSGLDSLVYRVCSLFDSSVCSTATLSYNVSAVVISSSILLPPNTGFGIPAQNETFYAWLAISSSLLCIGLVRCRIALLTKSKN